MYGKRQLFDFFYANSPIFTDVAYVNMYKHEYICVLSVQKYGTSQVAQVVCEIVRTIIDVLIRLSFMIK